MTYQPGGSAVPRNQQYGGNRQGGYGSGLGTPIQRYGQANPYGPFSTMPGAGGQPAGGGTGDRSGGGADSAARQYLTGVVSGQNTPYNQTTRDSMYSQQSNMAAGAEAGRNQQIAEQSAMGGASPTDPSYQRLIRQSMAQRQAQNQQSMGDIDRTASLANQQTQQAAAGTLMGSEDERYALSQGMNERASRMALGYLYGGGGGSGQPNSAPASPYLGYSRSNAGGMSQAAMDYRNTQEWQDDYNRGMQNDQYYRDMGL